MSQYIGKTIALISNTDNRYVGLLESIDSEKGVVTLRQVRCFGTEGRKGWGPEEIYPNPNIYDTVPFNAVSYTHLDVYKRQEFPLFSTFSLSRFLEIHS